MTDPSELLPYSKPENGKIDALAKSRVKISLLAYTRISLPWNPHESVYVCLHWCRAHRVREINKPILRLIRQYCFYEPCQIRLQFDIWGISCHLSTALTNKIIGIICRFEETNQPKTSHPWRLLSCTTTVNEEKSLCTKFRMTCSFRLPVYDRNQAGILRTRLVFMSRIGTPLCTAESNDVTVSIPPVETTESLFMFDLAPSMTEDDLMGYFKAVAIPRSIFLLRSEPTMASTGHAFVAFSHTDQAQRALSHLNYGYFGGCRFRMIQFRDYGYLKGITGKVLVNNIAEQVTEVQIVQMFAQFGHIIVCKLKRLNRPQRSTIKYGCVLFRSHEDARVAIHNLHNTSLLGRPLVCELYNPSKHGRSDGLLL